MDDEREIEYVGGLFCGAISSNFAKPHIAQFAKLLNSVLDDSGIVIYVYNKKEEKPDINLLELYFQIDIEKLLQKGQLVFVCSEDIFLNERGKLSLDKALDFYEFEIDKYRKKGFEKVLVYATKDKFYTNSMDIEEILIFQKEMKKLCQRKNIMIIVKYIVDDFLEKDLASLLSIHDAFIFDGAEKGYVYDYWGLMKFSLINLSMKEKIDYEHKEELKRMENLKILGELFESLAHDFNNLLSTIVGYSQMAILKESDPQIKDYLDIIYKTAFDGKAMMGKIKGYIKGSYNQKMGLHKINDILIDSINMAKYKIKNNNFKSNTTIHVVEELNSGKCIYCNEFEMRQVILNIILNAIDAMEDGGTLTVRSYDKDEKIFIEIEDTGTGMSEEIIGKVFEPFFTTKGAKGTGLGLNTTKKILENHSADILVDSKVGVGSKFTIIFSTNVKQCSIVKESELEPEMAQISAKNILVVDDRYSVASTVSQLIALLNIDADLETKGEKVLKRLEEKEYDLIICDYFMPNMNGIEVSKLVKEKYPYKPFVLMTGYLENNLYNVDTIDYILKKPYTIEELSQAIEKAFRTVDRSKNKRYNIS